jgi:hypothetical protein
MGDKVTAVVQERAQEGTLPCAEAFRIAEALSVTPLAVGEAIDALGVQLARCQLGLFGYGERKSIVELDEEVAPEMEQAIRESLILGRLPCAVAWAIAARFGASKLQVANAAEGLGIRISQCQLGAF